MGLSKNGFGPYLQQSPPQQTCLSQPRFVSQAPSAPPEPGFVRIRTADGVLIDIPVGSLEKLPAGHDTGKGHNAPPEAPSSPPAERTGKGGKGAHTRTSDARQEEEAARQLMKLDEEKTRQEEEMVSSIIRNTAAAVTAAALTSGTAAADTMKARLQAASLQPPEAPSSPPRDSGGKGGKGAHTSTVSCEQILISQ